jgi:hypothetical protein
MKIFRVHWFHVVSVTIVFLSFMIRKVLTIIDEKRATLVIRFSYALACTTLTVMFSFHSELGLLYLPFFVQHTCSPPPTHTHTHNLNIILMNTRNNSNR